MKKLIGIISYMPPKWGARQERLLKLHRLIDKATELFHLPILIIAQNYKDEEYNKLTGYHDNLVVLRYAKPLGITGAREELRQQFLSTDYDVIILLDDDCELKGYNGSYYLQEIEDHPGKIYERQLSLHKLMAVHRDVYALQEYDLVNTPEARLAYEDRLYFWTLVGNHPELHYRFRDLSVGETSVANDDKNSSWSKNLKDAERTAMNMRTDKLIEERTGKSIVTLYNSLGYKHK